MIWLDAVLKATALASAILASLRASSRASYLLTHEGIGVMDGPVIQKSNETYALFELSEAFKHCVQLASTPQRYQNLQTNVPVTRVFEAYPLSQVPYLGDDGLQRSSPLYNPNDSTYVPPVVGPNDFKSSLRRSSSELWRRQTRRVRGLVSMIPTSLSETKQYFTITPKVFNYWGKKVWNLRRAQFFKSTALNDPSQNDTALLDELFADPAAWDWDKSVKADLHFNANLLKDPENEAGGVVTRKRVAELSVFCPKTFQHLRNAVFGISESSFRESIFGSGPFVSFQSNSKGAARAGGVFFFTKDGAYMIKTIKSEEVPTFLEMLPKYHKHMAKHGRSSLLTRFCGMYGVQVYEEGAIDKGQLQTFVVMNAVFPPEASQFISERYDLKGSTVGREVGAEERAKKGTNAVLKDLDLIRDTELERSERGYHRRDDGPGVGLNIGEYAKAALLSQLQEDVKLLVECQVMDYSLLVGVAQIETMSKKRNALQQLVTFMQDVGKQYANSDKLEERALWAMSAPLRLLGAPPVYLASAVYKGTKKTISSIFTRPLPYFGAEQCFVDGGDLSVLTGTRKGGKAIYYVGVIDFLQPWSTKKILERKLKGAIGYDIDAISCVTPQEYATRFLEYLDKYLT